MAWGCKGSLQGCFRYNRCQRGKLKDPYEGKGGHPNDRKTLKSDHWTRTTNATISGSCKGILSSTFKETFGYLQYICIHITGADSACQERGGVDTKVQKLKKNLCGTKVQKLKKESLWYTNKD